jgi:hypothetical protein
MSNIEVDQPDLQTTGLADTAQLPIHVDFKSPVDARSAFHL